MPPGFQYHESKRQDSEATIRTHDMIGLSEGLHPQQVPVYVDGVLKKHVAGSGRRSSASSRAVTSPKQEHRFSAMFRKRRLIAGTVYSQRRPRCE